MTNSNKVERFSEAFERAVEAVGRDTALVLLVDHEEGQHRSWSPDADCAYCQAEAPHV